MKTIFLAIIILALAPRADAQTNALKTNTFKPYVPPVVDPRADAIRMVEFRQKKIDAINEKLKQARAEAEAADKRHRLQANAYGNDIGLIRQRQADNKARAASMRALDQEKSRLELEIFDIQRRYNLTNAPASNAKRR